VYGATALGSEGALNGLVLDNAEVVTRDSREFGSGLGLGFGIGIGIVFLSQHRAHGDPLHSGARAHSPERRRAGARPRGAHQAERLAGLELGLGLGLGSGLGLEG
jgi:hypothetical protein